MELYRDNGKENGNYCLGFRGRGMFWAWLIGGDRLLDLALLSHLRRSSDRDGHKSSIINPFCHDSCRFNMVTGVALQVPKYLYGGLSKL